MAEVVLCNLSDAQDVIDEQRKDWIFDVLDALGVPDEVYDSNNIDEYRQRMDDFGIEVILKTNGDVDIFKKQWCEIGDVGDWLPPTSEHLVAQWKEPSRIRRVEGKEVYYEIHLNEWSMMVRNE